jgi:hypothetical protein
VPVAKSKTKNLSMHVLTAVVGAGAIGDVVVGDNEVGASVVGVCVVGGCVIGGAVGAIVGGKEVYSNVWFGLLHVTTDIALIIDMHSEMQDEQAMLEEQYSSMRGEQSVTLKITSPVFTP